MRKYLYFIVLLILSSCTDKTIESQDLFLYLREGTNNIVTSTVLKTPDKTIGQSSFLIHVKATRNLVTDANIKFDINNSLVSEYNSQYNTEFKPLPIKAVSLSNEGGIVMKSGELESNDALEVKINDLSLLEAGESYLLPLQMVSLCSDDQGILISSLYSTMYLQFNIKYSNINEEGELLEGDEVDMSEVKVIYQEKDYSGLLYDDNRETGIFSESLPVQITLKIKENRGVKGIKLAPYSYWGGYLSCQGKNVKIETSNDGNTWRMEGNILLDREEFANYQEIVFYSPIQTEYIRMNFTEVHDLYFGLSELKIIK